MSEIAHKNFHFGFIKNKKSHWLQVSASKLLGDSLGNIKMVNDFLDENCKKNSDRKSEHHHPVLYI